MRLENVKLIKPNLMVHARVTENAGTETAASGAHVGTVDHREGDRFIKLKKSDAIDGRHHWIPVEWVTDVDDEAVYLDKTPVEVTRDYLDENPLNRH